MNQLKKLCAVAVVLIMLPGCASTSATTARHDSEWNMQNIGRGIQVGAFSNSSAGIFGPIVWGFGFVVERLGDWLSMSPKKERFGPLRDEADQQNISAADRPAPLRTAAEGDSSGDCLPPQAEAQGQGLL